MNIVAVTPQRTAPEISTRFIVQHWQTVVEMCESTSACIGSRRRLALGSRQRRRRRRRWRRKDKPQTDCPRPSPSPERFFSLLFYHYYYYSQLSSTLPYSPPLASLRALTTRQINVRYAFRVFDCPCSKCHADIF